MTSMAAIFPLVTVKAMTDKGAAVDGDGSGGVVDQGGPHEWGKPGAGERLRRNVTAAAGDLGETWPGGAAVAAQHYVVG
jgi:hypothetical protein